MISEANGTVKEKLMVKFPQLNSKQKMINYYVSFQIPDKQAPLARWWLYAIQFIIDAKRQIYINYKDLEEIVSINDMKPVPLKNVLQFHRLAQTFLKQSDLKNQKIKEGPQKSWFGNAIQYVWGKSPDQTLQKQFQFLASQKIISKRIKDQKKHQLAIQLKSQFKHQQSRLLTQICTQLSYKLCLNMQSILLIFDQMKKQRTIFIDQTEPNNKVLIYNQDKSRLYDQSFLKMEKTKCFLRAQVKRFEINIQKIDNKIQNQREKAKKCIQNSNEKKAKTIIVQIKQYQKNLESINNRKILLQQKIHQLQENQMNKSSFQLMEEAQKIYRQTAVDQSRFDQISDKNRQIQFEQKEKNEMFKQLAESNNNTDEVDDMMKELEDQISNNVNVVKQKSKIFVDNNREVHLVLNSNNKNKKIQYKELNFN